MDDLTQSYRVRGWAKIGHDDAMAEWVRHAAPHALKAASDEGNRAAWLRCGGTWFAGVNALGNSPDGRVGDSPPLKATKAMELLSRELGFGEIELDSGQVSVCYEGYPRPSEGESEAAFRFRRDRDAAHLDGLLPVGPGRRRMLREFHGFILGIPVTRASHDASPMVVWEGSHEVIRRGLLEIYRGADPKAWPDIDVTERYAELRREIFGSCARVPVHAEPGEAYVVHRLALHGVAPWGEGAAAPEEGRAVVYFRPELRSGAAGWLERA